MPTSKVTQTESGKAWEYGLARKFADMLNSPMKFDKARVKSQDSYDLLPQHDRNRIDRAAGEVVAFLLAYDERLANTRYVQIQGDKAGIEGDVRDILLQSAKAEIGISAKHRHNALKHSRLSDSIDFGKNWYGVPCSGDYWDTITPIFDDLRKRKDEKQRWSELSNKEDGFYVPILNAFISEVNQNADPGPLLQYLLGRHDFYKVIKENGNLAIQSFNMSGRLKWGKRLPPTHEIIQFGMKPKSQTTAIMYLDTGWIITFRLHNASSRVEPSLKFDVQLRGSPQQLSTHHIPYLLP